MCSADQRGALLGIEEAALGVEVMVHREPAAERRAQPLELVGEDDRVGAAVRVHQPDRARRRGERALDDRDHRRDAAAAGEGDDRNVAIVQHEEPGRAHHLDRSRPASASFIQFDMRPPGTRFTVVVKGSPVSGELDIE